MLENNIINRLYYSSTKSNSFKSVNPQTTKNSFLLSPMNTREYNEETVYGTLNTNENKTISKTAKKLNPSDFTNYLDKLASYENNKRSIGKK